MFESPVARGIFIYWIFAILAWWYPGFYRVRLGRRGEVGRSWAEHEKDFWETVSEDAMRAGLSPKVMLGGARIALSVGWPIMMTLYFYWLTRKCYRLRRLRRHRRHRARRR